MSQCLVNERDNLGGFRSRTETFTKFRERCICAFRGV